jgi:UDP-N-acetyl-2-amino-2-deoxyglucuronate dehydrogenase
VHYLSVCSPNYLHDSHVRLGLRVAADVICEKPLTINPWNLDALAEIERETGRRVFTVLQLRLVPKLIELKQRIAAGAGGRRHEVCLSYVTRRGAWYHASWKGDAAKSGGVAMNIGVHFFDLLLWLFGACRKSEVHLREPARMAGSLELEHADVRWFLSLDRGDLPAGYLDAGKPAYRSLTLDGAEVEFSEGFTELHTAVYRDILAGGGFGIEAAHPSVALVYSLRDAEVVAHPAHPHPALVAARGR